MKARVSIFFIGIVLAWMALVTRAAYLQIIPNEKLSNLKKRQSNTAVVLQARRGKILDRNNKELAASVAAYSLFADPSLIDKPKKVSKILSKELKISSKKIYAKIKNKKKRFVWVKRRLSSSAAEKIKQKKIRGLAFVKEAKRIYPNDTLMSQVLGFVGAQGKGLEGIEAKFDEFLSGKKVKLNLKKDARGRPLLINGKVFTESPDGYNLRLTVDLDLQYQLEKELLKSIEQFSADSAVGIILDAETSQVLAMANLPSFDPNYPFGVKASLRRNRVVTDPFEPGSTLKTFTVAAALENKKFEPNSRIFCENGKMKVGKYNISEADTNHNFGWLTLSEILAKSSNIGTSKVAFEIGDKALQDTLLKFGFYQKNSNGLIGESKGILPQLPWREHLLANISFGHGIATTPLQIANSYAAIANGGVLKQPYIVSEIYDDKGNAVESFEPKNIRRVLSQDVAKKLKIMLSHVTATGGTGTNAQVPGYPVAGKTGTAQKVKAGSLGYQQGAYISSFAGFVPTNAPRYVIYVAVDHPRKSFYGSEVAAPIFSRIAKYALLKDAQVPVTVSKNQILKIEPEDATTVVKVKADAIAKVKNRVTQKTWKNIPNLKGLSLRELIAKSKGQDLNIKLVGKGLVKETFPRAGELVPKSKNIKVILSSDPNETL